MQASSRSLRLFVRAIPTWTAWLMAATSTSGIRKSSQYPAWSLLNHRSVTRRRRHSSIVLLNRFFAMNSGQARKIASTSKSNIVGRYLLANSPCQSGMIKSYRVRERCRANFLRQASRCECTAEYQCRVTRCRRWQDWESAPLTIQFLRLVPSAQHGIEV